MRELRPGLCHWQARHPGWESSEPWDPNVSSYAIVEDERLLLLREGVAEGWRPLLELPVEHVLATHGGPFEHADLERALADTAAAAHAPNGIRTRAATLKGW